MLRWKKSSSIINKIVFYLPICTTKFYYPIYHLLNEYVLLRLQKERDCKLSENVTITYIN